MKFFLTNLKFCALALILAAAACKQEPVFVYTAADTEKPEPLIKGAPSKIVRIGDVLYVARDKLWNYGTSTGGKWKTVDTTDDAWDRDYAIFEIAAIDNTTDYLFALTMKGDDYTETGIWKSTDGGKSWESVAKSGEGGLPDTSDTGYENIVFQGLYTAGEALYFGGRDNSNPNAKSMKHYIWSYQPSSPTTKKIGTFGSDAGRLVGAAKAGSDYYVATVTEGIFRSTAVTDLGAVVKGSTDKGYITGIITLPSHLESGKLVVAPTSNENLLYSTGTDFSTHTYEDIVFNDCLYNWKKGSDYSLLVGMKVTDTTYTFGYREIHLGANTAASVTDWSLYEPGAKSPSTVDNNDDYVTSIGQRRVRSMMQDPADERVIFATTQNDGLWSYRYRARDKKWEWNTETLED